MKPRTSAAAAQSPIVVVVALHLRPSICTAATLGSVVEGPKCRGGEVARWQVGETAHSRERCLVLESAQQAGAAFVGACTTR